jgi:hypothetical protein
MTTNPIYLTPVDSQMLISMAQLTGRSEDELLHEALDLLKAKVDLEKRRSLLRGARGMWRDCDDLPDLAKLRSEMNRG